MGQSAPMTFSLRTAAQQSGVSKSTILRAVKAGRLSATRTDDGGYNIEPAELFRVYPPQQAERSSTDAMGQGAPATSDASAPGATAATLAAEIAGLREILRRADAAADELRQDRDRWRSMAENQQRLLADQRPRSWWRRIAG